MTDTTNIMDLPSDPALGGNNIILEKNETVYDPNVETSGVTQQSTAIDEQKSMNELVTGIQQASAAGATKLPSRDIPQNTVHFADEQIKPNFVPISESNEDYIKNELSEQEILEKRMRNYNKKDSLEVLYDELQIPIIICILYFIFQLPIVKSKFLSLLPSLHNSDGNPNLTGFVTNSFIFGITYYVISKTLSHFQNV
jgi:hypothetical protein